MKRTAKPPNITDVLSVFQDAIQNAVVLQPTVSALEIARLVSEENDPEMLAELGRQLALAHLAKMARAERAKAARTNPQTVLPGFEHLPRRIAISETERVPLREATYTQVRAYYRLLRERHRELGENSPKLKEAKALMERMERSLQKDRGVTVAQVLRVDAL